MSKGNFHELFTEWQELEETGIPLEPLEYRCGIDNRDPGRDLIIKPGLCEGPDEIKEMKNGDFAYTLSVIIMRAHPGNSVIRRYWIEPPWDDPTIEWLEDPAKENPSDKDYCMPGGGAMYPRESVLNHRMKRVLSRGDILEGLLLGLSFRRPPDKYQRGEQIEVTFNIQDQWCVHSANFQMQLIRRARPKQIRKSTRGPLFAAEDAAILERHERSFSKANMKNGAHLSDEEQVLGDGKVLIHKP